MPAGDALTADCEVLTFHKNTYVFDGLSIAYVLDEKYTERRRTRRPDIFGPLSAFGRQPYPLGVEGVAKLPNLTAGLFARGYKQAGVAAIMGGNRLRCIEKFSG